MKFDIGDLKCNLSHLLNFGSYLSNIGPS